jgi:hypothetical protein
MAITFVNAAHNNSDVATSGSTTVTAPASITTGDLLLAMCYADTDTNTAWTAPSGWTSAGSQYDSGNNNYGQVEVFYKIATGSEPGAYAFSGSFYRFVSILHYSGVNSTPIMAGVSWQNYTSGATASSFVAPSLTATGNAALAAFYTVWAGATISTGPSGMTLRDTVTASSHGVAYAYDLTVASGATGTETATMSSAVSGRAFTILVAEGTGTTANPGQFFAFF